MQYDQFYGRFDDWFSFSEVEWWPSDTINYFRFKDCYLKQELLGFAKDHYFHLIFINNFHRLLLIETAECLAHRIASPYSFQIHIPMLGDNSISLDNLGHLFFWARSFALNGKRYFYNCKLNGQFYCFEPDKRFLWFSIDSNNELVLLIDKRIYKGQILISLI